MSIAPPVITIDGPSAAGKGTLCRAIAKSLKWHMFDSGILYRVLALSALYNRVDIKSEEALLSLARYLDVSFISVNNKIHILLKNKNVTSEIRIPSVSKIASCIAIFPRVREELLSKQRSFRKEPGLVTDGRDMGTIVFPDAKVKIFLEAYLEERAKRRMIQLQKNGFNVKFEHILVEIKKRDECDRTRLISPLIPSVNTLILDSTNMSIEQVIKKTLDYIYQILKGCNKN
ncbi:(d)CMP kinase [Pantoea sp. Aalb]|uniref:(d)CMP kinase n=1 Tax=Pantoea sp. Aalb TaxID=2576762 RepID=UPI001320E604|nr:(d)CMP kinase [Pantoea sp. Aalb]MXP67495.1 (d)CMP kinase [Pantoea sp. Aalb]